MTRRFAQLGGNNIVRTVIVAESLEWCEETLGGVWVETFKDGSKRAHYAGIGFKYNEEEDVFVPPQPYPSWILSPETVNWEAPVPYPTDGEDYVWNENRKEWEPVVSEA